MFYQDQTINAIKNFGVDRLPEKFVIAYAEVKKACIITIQEIENFYDKEKYDAIIKAIDEILNYKLMDQFIVPLSSGGAGTSVNMNLNEVIAKKAEDILRQNEIFDIFIHPIDDINRYQSTNDTFSTAAKIALLRDLYNIEKLTIELQNSLVKKEQKYSSILIMGRTELQDALPMTLAQIFGSWAAMFERDRWRLHKLKDRIRDIALGGTAIGTGFPAPFEYVNKVENKLRQITGLPLCRSQNLPDAIANHDNLVELSNGYSLLANNIQKMANDFLLYTSSLCKEMTHPELQYGSTIMPFKVNPVLLEFCKGNTIKIKHLSNSIHEYNVNGNLQLNAFLPFIVDSLFEITELLTKTINAILKFVENLIINEDKIKENLNHSKAIFNLLLPFLGYSKSKEIINEIKGLNDLNQVQQILIQNGVDKNIVQNLSNSNIVGFIKKINKDFS